MDAGLRRGLIRIAWAILGLGWLPSGLAVHASGDGEIWVRVDTDRAVLEVLQGSQVKVRLPDISIGRFGTTKVKRRGDNRTPLGSYHVAWLEPRSRFHYFIGLDYPTPAQARAAAELGIIGPDERRSIERSFRLGRVPPQDTALGGLIGIHGLGAGDRSIHARYNWTRGCVALTDEQIDVLLHWVKIGTRVEVR